MYHDSKQLLRATIEGASVASALVLAQHVGLWHVQERLPLVARYTLGTLALYAGTATTLQRLGLGRLVLPLFAIPVAAGAIVALGHTIRHAIPDALDSLIEDGDSHAVWMPRVRRAG